MGEVDRFLGRPEVVAEGNMIKGGWIRWRRRYVEEVYGRRVVDEVARGLEGQARQFLLDPPATGWFPYSSLFPLDLAILNGPFGQNIGHIRALGERMASYDLTTIHRIFMRIMSPSVVAKKTPLIYRSYYQRGDWSVLESSSNAALFELASGGHPLYCCRYGVTGYLLGAMRLAGAADVQIAHVQCRHDGAPACRWQLRWG